MAPSPIYLRTVILTAVCFSTIIPISHCDIRELYSTKQKTSDLRWTSVGWEEVSGFNPEKLRTVRTYQVCKSSFPNQDNWLRTTFIPATQNQRLHIEIEFSITKCDNPLLKSAKYCRETFNLYYYESNSDVASSTFPPWRAKAYKKVDTVASNTDGPFNNKTFTVGPLKRNGLYIAIQDQGACMSINGLRVYYYYCHEKTAQLATFPTTNAGGEATSLVALKGECVANAQRTNGEVPTYHCNSDGKWKILTGGCQCDPGFKRNRDSTLCQPCAPGTFKADAGNDDCTVCPANSGPSVSSNTTSIPSAGLDFCRCLPGFFRAAGEKKTEPCTKPPTKPRAVTVSKMNATFVLLRWTRPESTGGRNDITYRVSCEKCGNDDYSSCVPCSTDVQVLNPKSSVSGGSTSIKGLEPFTRYIVKIFAENGVSDLSKTSPEYTETKLFTKESAPSVITSVYLSKRNERAVEIKWRPPQQPNGIIRKYEIEIRPKNDVTTKVRIAPILKETDTTTALIENLEPNTKYVIRIRTGNSAGFGAYSVGYDFETTSIVDNAPSSQVEGNTTTIVIIAVVVVVIIFVIVGLVIYYKCGRRMTGKDTTTNGGSQRHAQEPLIVNLPPPGHRIYVEYSDPNQAVKNLNKELDPTELNVLDKLIGEGEFAQVLHGNLTQGGDTFRVAVKQLKHGASVKDQSNFLREACSMAQFDHSNILQLKGVITKSRPVMIISEYMDNGSLDEYLRVHGVEIVHHQLVGMLQGIASGMSYLSKMKYVHRDLAARNILVNSDLICKVSDFGLSRTLENDPHATYTTQGGKIAIRWAAPECIRYRQFTSASDVWSYGIVMWEVMSYGEKPYWDMTNQQVVQNIESGMRLPAPTNCLKAVHEKMLECWSLDPNKRPKFIDLVSDLESLKKAPRPNGNITGNASSASLAGACATPNLQHALDHGEISTVEQWLKCQKLDKYKDRFLARGLDTLDKVSNLTIGDLRALGIDVTLHVHKLENGIKSLRRHLSTSSSRPTSSYSTEDLETGDDDVMLPNGHADTHNRPVRNGSVRRPATIEETEVLIPEGSVAV
ncbi:ephrin type-B receptor 3-like isoform X1 [Styela clava]